MQKWEYLRLNVRLKDGTLYWAYANDQSVLSKVKDIELRKYINKLGEEGWELVNVSIHTYYDAWQEFYDFKRPKG